jgi:hypothetical protein
MLRALAVLAVLATAARADEPSAPRRAAAVGAALFPGIVVHGAGSYVLDEKRAAKRIAITSYIGLGAIALGGAAVGLSGGEERFTFVGVPLIIGGSALFFPTWASDIWYAAGGPRVRGTPVAPAPWWIEAGTTYVHDAYRERALIRGAGLVEFGRIGVGGSALVDAEGRATTAELAGRVRLRGAAATGTSLVDGTRHYLRAALRRHADDDDRVDIETAEAEAYLRLDLMHVHDNLAGTFVECSLGMGVERVTYAERVTDDDSLFLGRFAWGLYLGTRSELVAYYDHRRDGLAGGIAAGRAAGFVGSVGTVLDLRVAGPFAFVGELQIGSAWVTTVGIRYHGGP